MSDQSEASERATLPDRLREAVAGDESARQSIREALSTLGDPAGADLRDGFGPAALGERFEPTIPAAERRERGQYYTPPEIVELVTRLCVESPDDAVLDPACGGGAMLAGAYDRLAERRSDTDRTGASACPLDRLYGIEVEAVPATLAAASLALRNGTADLGETNVAVADFFEVEPGATLDGADALGGTDALDGADALDGPAAVPEHVDAVVANPPYVRQEAIEGADRVRKHLDRPGVDANLDERSDLYAYFITHASEFLEPGGRLGVVTPTKWLGVGYGDGLRAFVRDRFRIEAVVGFDRRVFDDPLVPTCVTVLRRCADPDRRADTAVPFLRVEREASIDSLVERLSGDREPGAVETGEGVRLVTRRQGDLDPGAKWTRHLTAPACYWEIRDREEVCRLDDLASVSYGTKPGAVEFFFPEPSALPPELAGADPADSPWFRPAIKSIRDAERVRFEPADAERAVLDVHELVSDLLEGEEAPARDHRESVRAAERAYRRDADEPRRLTDEEVRVTALVAERGHRDLFEYVLSGVEAGYHDRATCAARRVWFDLGPLPDAPIVTGQFVWEDAPYLYLPSPMPVSNALCYVEPADGVDPALLAAVLNADVTRLFMEVHGRVEGGRALQLQVYEREALPVPDVHTFDADDAVRVTRRFEALLDAQERDGSESAGGGEDDYGGEDGDGGKRADGSATARAARRRLNEAVLGAMGLGDRATAVIEAADAATRARIEGGTARDSGDE